MTAAALLLAASVYTRSLERVASLDPIDAQAVYDSKVVQLLYETPLDIDYAARPYRLVPAACELPEVSADGRKYTFRMRTRAVTAKDAVASLERLRDPANASPGGWTMKAVERFDVLDDATFSVTLKERMHVFPWMMAMSYAAIRRPDGSGTGPYALASWRKNHEMRFVRNPAWWTEHAAETEPGAPFDELRFLVIDDASTQWLMFLKGELDFLGEISRDNWDAVVNGDGTIDPRLAAEGVRLTSIPNISSFYIGINMKDPVLGSNRKLRQALNCAFDSPAWKVFYNNRVEASTGPVPPGVDGRLEAPFAYAFDVEKAKRLLAEAGYEGGIDPATGRRLVLALDIGRASQDSRESGELLASFFARVGIRLELRFHTWGAFMKLVDEGRSQMYMMGWVGDYPDAENFLQLFHSRNVSPGANHSNYVNPDFDAAYDAAMAASDPEARNVLWRKAQEIVCEDCPWIFTHYGKSYSLVRPRVGNYIPSDFPYGQEKHLRVEETK